MSFDDPFIANSEAEARDAYRMMITGGYHAGSVLAEMHRWFPQVAIAQAEFDTHRWRDEIAWDEAHPRPADLSDLTAEPPAFRPEHWSQWTKDAHHRLACVLETYGLTEEVK